MVPLVYYAYYSISDQLYDLNNLTSEDVALLDEIPSDGSVIAESSDEEFIAKDVSGGLMEVEEENSEWEDDDLLPLINFVKNITDEQTKWSRHSVTNTIEEFRERTGPNISDEIDTPAGIFLALFSEDLVNTLVFQTNLYEVQNKGTNPVPTSGQEMKCFLAINIIMGIKKLPSYKDYWSSKREIRDEYISNIMSRDRFAWHLKNLHINDNMLIPEKGTQNYDKLYKVRPLLDKLEETFKNYYFPTKRQSIDESMIKFKGRSSLRQYLPLKPIKRGYKMWVRADEKGFISQFQIYTGKVESTEKNLASRVVKDLTNDLIGKGYEIYFDNFFNSVSLMKDLLKCKIYACGTLRKGRKGIPQDLGNERNMKRGDSDWRVSEEGLFILKWMDKKPILFLSNFHQPDEATISRKKKDGTKEDFPCFTVVKDYNVHMGYVDKADMLKSCYQIDRKSLKWWHRIFWHLLDVTIVNAYIIFIQRGEGQQLTLKEFKIAVSNGLVGASPNNSKKGRPPRNEKPVNRFKITVPIEKRTSEAAHMPIHGTKVRCTHCSTKINPHRTRWHCESCNVGLCLDNKRNCFKEFHRH